MTISVTQAAVFGALGQFLTAILPHTVEVVRGLVNRVPEPGSGDFVMMIPLRRERIETNTDSWNDQSWLGGISQTLMTVTEILAGKVQIGAAPSANVTLAPNTTVQSQISGPAGGIGEYQVAPAQNVAAGTIFQAGGGTYLQPTLVTFQLEVHGPNSADNAQIISTMMRDGYAVDFFAGLEGTGGLVVPCNADDPRQLAFSNDQQQVEERWIVEVILQVNASNVVPQQFADAVKVTPVSVDATFPP